MASRTLDQVVAELGNVYNPLAAQIEQRRSMIPGQIAEQEKGLEARQERAFGDILGQARQRGLGFSGIPISEQAKYTATEYMPALANLRRTGQEQEMSLTDAILSLNRDRRTQAQSIFDTEQSRDLAERQFAESQRQFNEQQAQRQRELEEARRAEAAAAARAASSASSFMPSLGALTAQATNQPQASKASYGFKNGRDGSAGFYFTDQAGRPVSAAKYAQLTGANIVQLLQKMAAAGDAGAKAAYGSLRGPGVTNQTKQQYQGLFWGA